MNPMPLSPDPPLASDPLRVLLWYRRGAGLHFSGPGRTAYRMYAADPRNRFRLTLVHGFPEHDRYDLFAQQVYLGSCGPNIPSQLKFIARGKRWLAQNARNFDVFHGLSGYSVTLTPAIYAQRAGLPAVVKLIAWRADMMNKQLWKTCLGVPQRRRRRLSQLAAVIAVAPAIVEELLEYGVPPERIARIPNGVDVQFYHPCSDAQQQRAEREQLGWSDRPTILFAGGINDRKQPQLLIEALGHLRAADEDCQLMLAGPLENASLAATMRQRADDLGVSDRVYWLGARPDMAPLYRAADVFCLPSQLEGMPNAVLEAMSSGLPAIVTPIPGSQDLVEHERTGRIVDGSGPELAEAIRVYLRSPQLRAEHGHAARERVLQQFDVRRVLDAHEQLFRRVMRGQCPADVSLF
jgi:glycosyltransferase involved in cell wall biosynthesis